MAGVGVFSGGLDEVIGIVDGGNRKIFFLFIYTLLVLFRSSNCRKFQSGEKI